MAENTIQWDKDADGIVTLTLDDPTGSANVMNEHYAESMHNAVERLVAEKDSITGVVITSAKKTFFAGGDLKAMINAGPENVGDISRRRRGIPERYDGVLSGVAVRRGQGLRLRPRAGRRGHPRVLQPQDGLEGLNGPYPRFPARGRRRARTVVVVGLVKYAAAVDPPDSTADTTAPRRRSALQPPRTPPAR
jgi:enoyl-CoA hydratase/isomerase-like protein